MKITDFVNENVEKPIGLFSGYLFFLLLLFSFKAVTPDISILVFLLIILFTLIIWTLIWYIIRKTLPKNKKDKIGIIISISTENDNQKIRIKNDFIKRLKNQTKLNDIDNLINIIQIGSTKTQSVNQILTDYTQNNKYKSLLSKEAQESIKSFNNLKEKIKGHFYIWGDIKERMDIEKKYFLELEGLVLHSPLNDPIQAKLKTEFNLVWTRGINFMEKIEFKGFLLSADLIFIAVDYVLGLAAYFTGDVILAETLHTRLEKSIPQETKEFPNIKHIIKNLNELIPIELNLSAIIQTNKGDAIGAEEYLKRSFQRVPENNYSALITQSLIQFTFKRDPVQALITVRKAKKCSGNDGTWRYNEAFLLMYQQNFPEALSLYKDIAKTNFQNEESVLAEVLEFNRAMIKQSPNFYQSYFCLGYLFYKKIGNCPEAYTYFEQFIDRCKDPKFRILIDLANKYLNQLSLRLKLK